MAPSDPSAYSKTERDVLCKIAWNYLVYTPPRNREEQNEFNFKDEIPTTGYRKELIGKAQGRKGELEAQFELISVVNMFSKFSYNVKCKEVCFWD